MNIHSLQKLRYQRRLRDAIIESPKLTWEFDTPLDLRGERRHFGFTQQQMAKLLGLSTRMYQYYEAGEREDGRTVETPFTVRMSVEYLKFLMCDLDDIIIDYELQLSAPSSTSGKT